MSDKLKELAGAGRENQLISQIKSSANQIWLAGLGAFAKAQEEGTKVFDALVQEGMAVQARTAKVADAQLSDIRAKATGTWEKLEEVFEDRVQRALHSLNVPTKRDIDNLSKRVAELTEATKRLSGGTRKAAAASAKKASSTKSSRKKA